MTSAVVFNTRLAKLLKGLKKDAGARTIRRGYKGTGGQAHRRQIWVRFTNGALIDLWLESDEIRFGGVMPRSGRVTYENRSLDNVYYAVVQHLKAWTAERKAS